ncbi:Uncharacterized conserved protein, DUF2147 family [Mitsuaria sp. PDC51]|jgi:uncharacterized protein (DUF2147 family)|nr:MULTISPECIES: DUF2147 domain-containing protein [unclassified Roseateles]MBB3294769.1 uncharacterized protein (DUF2147 family) [Mitsuaria sp. BK041]MBB3363985.1 uncharacterized protein (DUF2147 family) [Mitsuaria sp. BK045]SFR87505.1 Uncharacterized conserved protein, DUF2147 family [Mitsuaria sp. PDC51]
MKPLFATAVALGLGLSANLALAQAATTPVGVWKTIDDETKQERSTVRISEVGGVLTGKIEKITDPTKQTAKCDECADERKGQPILGLTILRNVKKNGNDAELWDGGDILDPGNGKVYRVRLRPIDGGKKLEVRGFVGMPLLGRTQTWIRVE